MVCNHFLILGAFSLVTSINVVLSFSEEYSCENTICNPRAGDLLIGRESSLRASSTCGLNEVSAYCVVTTSGKSFCKECTSKQPYNPITNPESHRIENVVSRVPSNPGRWWQSQNGIHNVSIVLNLDTQFQFISTILRFKTYRPAAMYLERSYDFGRTWKRYAYFSNNCKRDFPTVHEGPRRSLNDVTCTGIYSQLTPSEGGVVAFMAAPSEMQQSWPQYSKERMNLTAVTNLRASFQRINTLGDMSVDDSSLTKRKYYYALYEWNVWGRCTCFGHASRCKPKSSAEIIKPEKVYGVCECTHNTAGENCETCADFHWNKPWRPATRDSANACEKCNCNNHATACFFNPVLYVKSNNVSGGNCHSCMHNTEGVNCEFCQPNFYRNPGYPIDHPLTCLPCNCHTEGTLHENFCQQYTIPEQGTVAGRCICKKNVGGDKCDRCKIGFWNFQAQNIDGCEACSCNMIGTLDNGGCDPFTGLCTCKRFVDGPNCDRCMEGYFNLTTSIFGCEECGCSTLGSLSPICDGNSGKCSCKVGFTGRDCSQIEDGYFVRPPTETIDREREKEISIDAPKGDGKFVIVLDVDPKQFGEGDKWTIIVTPYQYGARRCQNPPQSVDIFQDTHKVIISDVCLESGLPLVLRIMPESQPSGPFTEILITDIVLIPTDDSELARMCEPYRELAFEIIAGRHDNRTGLLPQCEAYFRLQRVSWKDTGSKAERCFCNSTGSQSDVCNKQTGQCPCKPGVIGRQCDQCAPYHYNFGARGCTDCACNPQGSLSLQCNEATSMCNCRPGIVGKHCDSCTPGMWRFPDCRPCYCNGYSEICNQTTGICENCRENTGGDYCNACREGFYGEPLRGKPCKPCSCPGGDINHAKECRIGQLDEQICICKPGYVGPRCSQCAVNYFGNPMEPGGSCQPCQCSGNIQLSDPNSCDPVTGHCLKCLHNTEGIHCDVCKEGYWGDATRQMCQPCNCYPLGSVADAVSACDRRNGQCACLPYVVGARCYECAPGYFNLTSGTGCESCLCDMSGSLDEFCDPINGQCRCTSERGGRQCDQCPRLFYGDPKLPDGCKPCNCNMRGSLHDVCDPLTGQCLCLTGVAGRQCDHCDRGTEGILPHCKPCGECWTNWDNAIDKVRAELNRFQNQTGQQLPKELKVLFDNLMNLLEQIENIPIMRFNEEKLEKLRDVIKKSEDLVNRLGSLDNSEDSWAKISENLVDKLTKQLETKDEILNLKQRLENVISQFDGLTEESLKLEHQSHKAAYASIMRSNEAKDRMKTVKTNIEYRRSGYETDLISLKRELEAVQSRATQLNNEWSQFERMMTEFNEQIRQNNRLICGDNSVPPESNTDLEVCPSNCGGAGCLTFTKQVDENDQPITGKKELDLWTGLINSCGTNAGCNASTVGRLRALMDENLQLQINLINTLQAVYRAEQSISKVHFTRKDADQLLKNSSNEAKEIKKQIEDLYAKVETLVNETEHKMEMYRGMNKETFDELYQTLQDVKLNVTTEESKKIANKINSLVRQLTSKVDEILSETSVDIERTKKLLTRAKTIRDNLQDFVKQINQLNEASRIYEEIKSNPTIQQIDEFNLDDKTTQAMSEIDGFNTQVNLFARESSQQSDNVKQSLDKVGELLAGAKLARRQSMDALQQLEHIEISFKQLDEKMKEIDDLMNKLNSDSGATIKNDSIPIFSDPNKFMQEVQNYTVKIEQEANELKSIMSNLKRLESQSNNLVDEYKGYIEKTQQLSTHLSRITKYHQVCK